METMGKRWDIALSENFDLKIENGDFVLAESTRQHQNLLLLAHKGEFKAHPRVGVGLSDYLLDDASVDQLEVEIQNQFENDGMSIDKLKIDNDYKIEFKAEYKDGSNTSR